MEACKVERVVLNALAKHKCGFAGQLSLCASFQAYSCASSETLVIVFRRSRSTSASQLISRFPDTAVQVHRARSLVEAR
jgi:hypothetical protein